MTEHIKRCHLFPCESLCVSLSSNLRHSEVILRILDCSIIPHSTLPVLLILLLHDVFC